MRRLLASVIIISSLCLFSAHTATAATVTVNYNDVNQQIEGFGASGAWYENWITDAMDPDTQNNFYNAVFSDLGLDIYRIRNTYDYDAGYINRTKQIVEAGKARNPNLKIMISSWSPPGYLKSCGQTTCYNGTLKKDGDNYVYEDFAQWWADSLEEFAGQGMVADYINIQNEPDFSPGPPPYQEWDSCRFEPSETSSFAGYDQAFEAVYQKLYSRMGSNMPKMLAPESADLTDFGAYVDSLINENHVYGFAHHLYDGTYSNPDGRTSDMETLNSYYGYKPLFQTEYSDGPGQVNFSYAMYTARYIHNSLVHEQVCSYLYWDLFWATHGLVAFNSWGNPNFSLTPCYYAFKHYAYYTDPGWFVLDCTPKPNENLRMTAFKNPENDRLTVVILNKSTTAESLSLTINDFVPVYSEVYLSSETKQWVSLGEFSNPIFLPAKSITTISLTSSAKLSCSSTAGGFISSPGEGDFGFTYGSTRTIVAEPIGSYYFVNWTGTAVDAGRVADPNSASTSVLIDDNYTLIANFAKDAAPVVPGAIVDWGVIKTNTDLTGLIDLAAGGWHSLGLKEDGSIVAWGDNSFGQSEIPAGNDFAAVAAGEYHSLALTADGSVVAWGDNEFHQCRVPSPNTDFVAIAAGSNHCLALKADGRIVAWGLNNFGQRTLPAGNDFVAIAAGYWHSLALKSDGSLIAWGNNDYGQITVPAGNDFIDIAAGDFHNLALKSDGTIVAWGFNDFGQTDVPDGNNFIAVAAGADHSLALTADGKVVAWGSDNSGQTDVPAGLNDVLAVVAGDYHSLALKTDGTVVGWGNNDDGQAVPPTGNDFVSVSVGGFGHVLALRQDGSLVGWGYNEYGQADPPAGNDFIAVAAGGEHSLALKSDGSIIGWGSNKDYLGNDCNQAIPPSGHYFSDVAAGAYHSLALKSDGSIFAWGCNDDGQTDVPSGNDFIAIAAGWYHSLALRYDGSIVAWGWDRYGQAQPPDGDEFIAIAAGWGHSLALHSAGFIVGWGCNDFGEIDVPEGFDFVAIAAGMDFGLALKSDGSLIGWGTNDYGQAEPLQGSNFTAIAAGGRHGVALVPFCKPDAPTGLSASDGNFPDHIHLDWEPVPDAEVYEIWRSPSSDMTPASIIDESVEPSFDDFVSTRTTYYYRVRVRNSCGTGIFSSVDSGYICIPPSTDVSASDGQYSDHIRIDWNTVSEADSYEIWRAVSGGSEPIVNLGSFASPPHDDYNNVTPGLTYYYWVRAVNACGKSYFGLIDSGYVDNSSQSYGVSGGKIYAWGINKYGQATPPDGNDFVAVSAGYYHSIALKRDGSIVGFGCNTNGSSTNPIYYGQANPPAGNNFVTVSAGGFHSLALKSDGSIAGWGANFYGQTLPPDGHDFVVISAGYIHSLALKADGSIVAWGNNYYGQASPPVGNDFIAVSAGNFHSLALKNDGSIVAWGGNYYDLLNTPAGNDFAAVSAGYYYNVALKNNGSIVTWGRDASTVMTPPAGNNFVSIAAGMQQSLALTPDGYVTAWGYYDADGFYAPPDCNGFIAVSTCGTHYLAIATKPVDLNEPSPLDADIDVSVAKCTVRAGKDRTQEKDAVSISGLMDATVDIIEAADFIEVTVDSDDMNKPLICRFPVNDSTFKKGRFKSSLTDNASKTSLAFNTKTLKFSYSAKNVNLSGLSCPIVLTVKIGGASGSVDIGESTANGKKLVPIVLLMGVEDSLRVDFIKLKRGSRPNSDQLSVKGAFSVAAYVNMAATSFSATIGGQTFTIPEGVFKPGKGKYTCPMVDLYDSPEFTAAATFDFSKCTFKLTIKNTKININPGDTVLFTITFGTFNEEADVFLP